MVGVMEIEAVLETDENVRAFVGLVSTAVSYTVSQKGLRFIVSDPLYDKNI
jgi:hypothetical protein